MRTSVSSPPASEPVSLSEAKAHLRIDHTAEDTLIAALITAARRVIEAETERKLVTQTVLLTLDATEAAPPIILPHGPVQSVSLFEVYTAGAWATVATTAYDLLGDRLAMSEDDDATDWPTADRRFDAFRVTYVAGYGVPSAVPQDLKSALLITLGDLYENRETLVGSGLVVTSAPTSAKILCYPYKNFQL
jgi:uncharacterized phiE125 gp8 family phage protein